MFVAQERESGGDCEGEERCFRGDGGGLHLRRHRVGKDEDLGERIWGCYHCAWGMKVRENGLV